LTRTSSGTTLRFSVSPRLSGLIYSGRPDKLIKTVSRSKSSKKVVERNFKKKCPKRKTFRDHNLGSLSMFKTFPRKLSCNKIFQGSLKNIS